MSSMTEAKPTAARPLTVLDDEEKMFRSALREFARKEIGPFVREMDETAVLRKDLLGQLFANGLMGIEIPEEYGGQGGSFFQSVLAVEELAAVDPSVAVIVDVQNTLVDNAILHWGTDDQKRRYLPRLAEDTVGAYALSEASSGSDAFALQTRATRDGDGWLLTGRKLWITNAAEAGIYLVFANADPEAGYKGITCFIVERDTPGFQVGKKEDKLGIRASSTCELILDNCPLPAANVLGEVGKGYQRRHRDPERGPDRNRRSDARARARGARPCGPLRQGPKAVREADRRIPGRAVRSCRNGGRGRGRPPPYLQRRPPPGRRLAICGRGGHGQVFRLHDRRAVRLPFCGGAWRRGIYPRLPG